MSHYYRINFYKPKKLIDEKAISDIVKWLNSLGCRYTEFWSDKAANSFQIPLEEALRKILDGGALRFIYKRNDFALSFRGELSISVDMANFSLNRRFADFVVKLAKELYYELQPERVVGEYDWEFEYEVSNHVSWINIFGPAVVKKIGKAKLLSAPVYKASELRDGGIMLLIVPSNPMEASEEMREKVRKHIFGGK